MSTEVGVLESPCVPASPPHPQPQPQGKILTSIFHTRRPGSQKIKGRIQMQSPGPWTGYFEGAGEVGPRPVRCQRLEGAENRAPEAPPILSAPPGVSSRCGDTFRAVKGCRTSGSGSGAEGGEECRGPEVTLPSLCPISFRGPLKLGSKETQQGAEGRQPLPGHGISFQVLKLGQTFHLFFAPPPPHSQEVQLLAWVLEEREKRTVPFFSARVPERPDSLCPSPSESPPPGERVAPPLHRQKWGTLEAGWGRSGLGDRGRSGPDRHL